MVIEVEVERRDLRWQEIRTCYHNKMKRERGRVKSNVSLESLCPGHRGADGVGTQGYEEGKRSFSFRGLQET